MSTEPDEIRARIAALLAELPDVEGTDPADVDIDSLAARLEEAHELLVHALESVEKVRLGSLRNAGWVSAGGTACSC